MLLLEEPSSENSASRRLVQQNPKRIQRELFRDLESLVYLRCTVLAQTKIMQALMGH